MRALRVLSHDDATLFESLRSSLSGDGPAILPRAHAHSPSREPVASATFAPLPTTVPVSVALVIETSGSTGEPKRVALSTNALLASAAMTDAALGGPGQWVLALPPHHIAGASVLVRSLVAGTVPVTISTGSFTGERFARAAEALTHERRYASLVPVQLMRLLDAAEDDSRVRAHAVRMDGILVGGQAVPSSLIDRARRAGVSARVTYGSTETCGGCVYDGYPIGATQVRERDGLLEIAGPHLSEGYLGNAVLTRDAFSVADGVRWFRTRDRGTVDDRGRVTVAGRADNLIISGGVKISLDAVELAVRDLARSAADSLAHAVVVADDSAQWGQTPVVVIGPSHAEAETTPTLEMLRNAVVRRVGRASAPGRLVKLEAIPTLESGKPDRHRIREIVRDDTAHKNDLR